MDEDTEDDFEEKDDLDGSKKENTDSDDDWSSNIYVFKFGEGYYSFHVDVLINIFILFYRHFNIFLLHYALSRFGQLWICACYLNRKTFGRLMFPRN